MSICTLTLAPTKYDFIAKLRKIQRRDLIWVSSAPGSKWTIIPQTYGHVRHRPGDHCLLHDRSLVCQLHEGLGYGDLPVLAGRDSASHDWLVFKDRDPAAPPDRWVLTRRSGLTRTGLPDSFLEGATTRSRIERLVEAALVLAEVSYEGSAELPGRPDFTVPKLRVAILAHGCRQHAHGCSYGASYGRQPTPDEITNISSHDESIVQQLNFRGWRVLTVWECGLSGPGSLESGVFVERLKRFIAASTSHETISAD